ncbi:MAG TPA: aminotransferase, partial [Agromyces sp.]|nr:aminotransferase [Agromyces sp.]
AQDAAASRIAASAPDLRIATTTTDAAGTPRSVVAATSEGRLRIRLIEYLHGGTLTGDAYLSPKVVARMGELAARASLALGGFDHPGLDRLLQWDPRVADRVVALLADHHPDPAKRDRVTDAAAVAWADLDVVAGDLPMQAVHLDLTDDNVVCTTEHGIRVPDGMIDFGDVTRTWAVAELAIAISSVLHHAGAEPVSVLPAVRAFHALRPLSPAEVAAIWPLVVLRAAVLVVSGEHQVQLDGGTNVYAASGIEREWRVFRQAVAVPTPVMSGVIAAELGLAPVTAVVTRPSDGNLSGLLTPGLDTGSIARLDVSITSDDVDAGAWLAADLENKLAHDELDRGATAAILPWRTPRLTAADIRSPESSPTVPTGVDVWFAEPQPLTSTADGHVAASGDGHLTVVLDDGIRLDIEGGVDEQPALGTRVTAGDALGLAASGSRIRMRLQRADAPAMPHLVRPEYAPGWLALAADPAPMLGLAADGELEASVAVDTAPAADAAGLIERRARAFAGVQEHYYDAPPRIERGWREHLIGTDGRVYLDMVNNVTPLGHGHPKVADAIARQLRRLNTNSRFNYGAVVEFSERLAATLPEPLDTVFLVNSGSEAVDLALRVAFAATGRRDVVAILEAYHGWTYASDAVSTSVADNPHALMTRPDWVHAIDAPNPFRGRYRGTDATRYAPDAAARIDELATQGRPLAAFIAETFFGNAGGIPLPDGYLAEVYAAVRTTGGLAIADEVQAGYGRLGHWFWGFEQQGVVPDIVAVAKAAGNGHPLGAVVTTREIAARF